MTSSFSHISALFCAKCTFDAQSSEHKPTRYLFIHDNRLDASKLCLDQFECANFAFLYLRSGEQMQSIESRALLRKW